MVLLDNLLYSKPYIPVGKMNPATGRDERGSEPPAVFLEFCELYARLSRVSAGRINFISNFRHFFVILF
jgi:hypothetical protein